MTSAENYNNFLRGYQQDVLQDVENFTGGFGYGDIPRPNQPGRNQYDQGFFNILPNMQGPVSQAGYGRNTAVNMAGFGAPAPSYELRGIGDRFGETAYASQNNLSPREQQARAFGYQGDFGDGAYQDWWTNLSNSRQQALKQNNPLSNFQGQTGPTNQAGRGVGFTDPGLGRLSPREQQARAFGYEGDFGGGAYQDWWTGLSDQRQQALKQNNPIGNFLGGGQTTPSYAQDVNPGQLSDVDVQQYMNPYRDAVIEDTLDDIQQRTQEQNSRARNNAIAQGAYGGSRSAILEAENNQRMQEEMAQAGAQMRDRGFQSAVNQAQFDIENDLRGQRVNQTTDLREAGLQRDWFNTGMNQNRQKFQMQNTLANQQRAAGEYERSLDEIDRLNANREAYFPLEMLERRQSFLQGTGGAPQQPIQDGSLPSFSDNPIPYISGGLGFASGINDLTGGGVTSGLESAWDFGSGLFGF